jgi:hypothetical protein
MNVRTWKPVLCQAHVPGGADHRSGQPGPRVQRQINFRFECNELRNEGRHARIRGKTGICPNQSRVRYCFGLRQSGRQQCRSSNRLGIWIGPVEDSHEKKQVGQPAQPGILLSCVFVLCGRRVRSASDPLLVGCFEMRTGLADESGAARVIKSFVR